jgi:hypothetical protein
MEAAAPIIRPPTIFAPGRQITGNITVEVCASGRVPKTGFLTGRRVLLGRRYALVSIFEGRLRFQVKFPSNGLWMPEISPLRSLPVFAPGLSGDRPHPEPGAAGGVAGKGVLLQFGHDHRGLSWCRGKRRPGAPFILEDGLWYSPITNPRRCCNLDETHMLNL